MSRTGRTLQWPSRRFAVAAGVGLLSAGLMVAGQRAPGFRTDWDALWVAGHALMTGHDPYVAAREFARQPHGYAQLYPATAILLSAPIAVLPRALALGVWIGLGMGALTYAVTSRTWWGLLALVSPFALHAYFSAQWSPLLTAGVAIPWLGLAWVAKPSIGAALFVAYPSRRVAVYGAGLVGLTFVLWPGWVAEWRAALATTHHLVPVFLRPGGWLLLLAWLRWREPEARLVGMLGLVPHTLIAYDFLTLALLLRSRAEWMVGTALAWAGYLSMRTWGWIPPSQNHDASVAAAWPFWLAFVYLPAVMLVLGRGRAASHDAPRVNAAGSFGDDRRQDEV